MKCSILSLVVVLLGNYSTWAQYSNLKFQGYSTPEGLSSSTCLEVFQDSEGYIWVGTIDGLNKFDGYSFEIFRPHLGDTTSISNNRVYSIVEDKYGNLWIGTLNGLNVYLRDKEIFKRISLHEERSGLSSNNDVINDIVYDETRNNIWVATNNGVSKASLNSVEGGDFNHLFFVHYPRKDGNQTSRDVYQASNLALTTEGEMWAVTNGKFLHRFNENELRFDPFYTQSLDNQDFDHLPNSLLIDHNGRIWFGNDLSRLLCIDINRKARQLSIVKERIPIYSIYQSESKDIWVATANHGIYILDTDGKLIQHIEHDKDNPFSLPINQTSKLIEDRTGIFWIATYNAGVAKLDLSKSLFGHYFYQPEFKNGLSTKIAQFVMQDRTGKIWIGTDGGGLNLFNEKQSSFRHYRHNSSNPSTLSSDKILYLEESHDGSIWVCTWDAGINRFYPATGKSIRYKHNDDDQNSIGQNTAWCALEDTDHRIWVGTQTAGINVMDPSRGGFRKFLHDPSDPESVTSDLVFSVYEDSRQRLLIGTLLGMCWVDLRNLSDIYEEAPVFVPVSEINDLGIRVNYMTEDHMGNIWIGSDLGLHMLDANLKWKHSFTMDDGLPNNLILGVVEDRNKMLWITTKSGISLFNPKTKIFKNFNVSDGLQGLEFQSKSITKTRDGRIIAGGINGFNMFDPDQIMQDSSSIIPQITELKVLNQTVRRGTIVNKRVLFDKSLEEVDLIELKHNEGYLAFEFGALYFKNPRGVRYAYKMHGVDQDYFYTQSNREVNYSALRPGSYTFEVLASLDGQWQEAGSVKLNFEVLPPMWQTWWAYTIYTLLTIAVAYVFINYFGRIVREERERELDHSKLQFFMNVSHEFRTPLTLILNPVDKIISSYDKPEIVQEAAGTIQRSARKLLNLVNQLLELRRIDLGKAPLDPIKADIVEFTKDVHGLFSPLAQERSIDFEFQSPPTPLMVWFDPDKLEKIISNLLSNALKFTPENGSIELSIEAVTNRPMRESLLLKKPNTGFVAIKVKDSGIGLKKEHQDSVFDRFFHLDNSKTGTGIGLNFTKSLVEQHGGTITVDSTFGSGSCFTVKIPLESKQLQEALRSNQEIRSSINTLDVNSIKSLEYQWAISGDEIDDEGEEGGEDNLTRTVLIVEDNKELRQHLKNELNNAFKIKQAVNGKEGLEKALKYFPDLIISDVMMPEKDGFEMCNDIKNNPETSHIPIILLTARSLEEDRLEGYSMGADAYLPKPFNISVLKVRIKNLLESKKRLQEKFSEKANILPSSEITTNTLDEQFLDKATNTIIDNIGDSEFDLDQLLSVMAFSRSQFYRKVRSLTGLNPSNFIRTVRLKYAAELLKQGSNSIKEVSFKSGFNSTAYFSKTFKELFGMTPNEYVSENVKSKEKVV